MSAITTNERIHALEVELDVTKRTLANTRRKLKEKGRHADRIRQAHVDSLVLAAHHVAFLHTSRRAAAELGAITQRRWEGAIGLMRLAGVHNGRWWLCHDLEEITSRLEKASQVALDCPTAFFARLNKHAKQDRKW